MQGPAELLLQGAVTMACATALVARGRELARAGDLVVDFSAVDECDSSALALLFDWMRAAQAAGHRVSTRALPPTLASLAALYGVSGLIPAAAV